MICHYRCAVNARRQRIRQRKAQRIAIVGCAMIGAAALLIIYLFWGNLSGLFL